MLSGGYIVGRLNSQGLSTRTVLLVIWGGSRQLLNNKRKKRRAVYLFRYEHAKIYPTGEMDSEQQQQLLGFLEGIGIIIILLPWTDDRM